MRQYHDLIRHVLEEGELKENRTGIQTLCVPGAMMRFNLQNGFPAVTTKKLAFKSVVGELCGFLRASRSAAEFRALGCKVWDQNANENQAWLDNPYRLGADDLGPVYGVQWREWPAYKRVRRDSSSSAAAFGDGYEIVGELDGAAGGAYFNDLILHKTVDQLGDCVRTIINDPDNRRILFHAWNPAELDAVALPACHLLYQFLPNKATKELSMCLYLRSNDLGLGAPFNLAEGAALLELVSRLTGYKAKWFTYFVADAHIYVNHREMLETQLAREPYPLPKFELDTRVGVLRKDPTQAEHEAVSVAWLDQVKPSDFQLIGYQHHDPITAPMAV